MSPAKVAPFFFSSDHIIPDASRLPRCRDLADVVESATSLLFFHGLKLPHHPIHLPNLYTPGMAVKSSGTARPIMIPSFSAFDQPPPVLSVSSLFTGAASAVLLAAADELVFVDVVVACADELVEVAVLCWLPDEFDTLPDVLPVATADVVVVKGQVSGACSTVVERNIQAPVAPLARLMAGHSTCKRCV